MDLGSVPPLEVEQWRDLGFTHIWLMGVWTSGSRARAHALASPDLRQALPLLDENALGASPYAISSYSVPQALGGESGLASLRGMLHERGLKLLLDFVPNHTGLDHPWIATKPELFVQSSPENPGCFLRQTCSGIRWLAHGRDPYFAPWTDTAQLDYRQPATQQAMARELESIARRCDGVRCDMSMLALNKVFAQTWGHLPPLGDSAEPVAEFWDSVIPAIQRKFPEFLFLAEAYWGLEPTLQDLGFDFTYDKTLYDNLVGDDGAAAISHLKSQGITRLGKGARFLENHDEPRIASRLTIERHFAAALLTFSVPGMRFLHEGQLEGAQIRIPVQYLQRPVEKRNEDIWKFYRQLLQVLRDGPIGRGEFSWLSPATSEDAPVFIAKWQAEPSMFQIVAVNYSAEPRTVRPDFSHPLPSGWKYREIMSHPKAAVAAWRQLDSKTMQMRLKPYAARVVEFRRA